MKSRPLFCIPTRLLHHPRQQIIMCKTNVKHLRKKFCRRFISNKSIIQLSKHRPPNRNHFKTMFLKINFWNRWRANFQLLSKVPWRSKNTIRIKIEIIWGLVRRLADLIIIRVNVGGIQMRLRHSLSTSWLDMAQGKIIKNFRNRKFRCRGMFRLVPKNCLDRKRWLSLRKNWSQYNGKVLWTTMMI